MLKIDENHGHTGKGETQSSKRSYVKGLRGFPPCIFMVALGFFIYRLFVFSSIPSNLKQGLNCVKEVEKCTSFF